MHSPMAHHFYLVRRLIPYIIMCVDKWIMYFNLPMNCFNKIEKH